ncbi:MAG TPA: YceI family protein [Pseudonocardiaceae bacterium]|nr:YceI family protein [Pseudonocardiaceae bacterium]
MGHDLTLEVTSWSADVTVDGDSADVSGRVDLASIAVREGTGGVKPLTDRDRREIAHTARRLLDTDHQPEATFRSTDVTVTDTGGTIAGVLTIKGIDQPFVLEVNQTRPGHYRATGTVVQSAYGIKPYTAFFGALKLADRVTIDIETELDEDHHGAA